MENGRQIASGQVDIRAATPEDVAPIVQIHRRAFPGFFLTHLGAPFLRAYYRLVLDQPGGILLVAEESGAVVGFIAGFLDPRAFYRTMRERKWRLLPAVAAGLLGAPWLLPRVVASVLRVSRRGNEAVPRGPTSCELASLAVVPRAGGRGIGRSLVAAFMAEAARRGASEVHLTTDAEGNDRVNAFYESLGFHRSRQFVAFGARKMNEYARACSGGRAGETAS
jgi:ribosomal protein S18 acetylase RimI-like enzyme